MSSKSTIKLLITVAGIAALGQSCAKDMTTQDYDAELARENVAKMQVHAGTYHGARKNSAGQTVGPLTAILNVQTENPGSNNNTSQSVGFGGVLEIDVQGQPQLRLSFNNAYFDFSDAGNYSFNPKITMPDQTTTDTIEVSGQFPDENTMTGSFRAGDFSDPEYAQSFSLTRDGPSPAPASLSSASRSGLFFPEGAYMTGYVGTATFNDGSTAPIRLQLASRLTADEEFYSYIFPKSNVEFDAIITLDYQNPIAYAMDFKDVQYDQIHGVFSGSASNSNNADIVLNCSQPAGSSGWNCSTNLYTFSVSPAASAN